MFANNFFPMLITLFAVLIITAFYSPWLAVLLIGWDSARLLRKQAQQLG